MYRANDSKTRNDNENYIKNEEKLMFEKNNRKFNGFLILYEMKK